MTDLNVIVKTVTFLEQKHGRKFYDLKLDKDLVNRTQKAGNIKEKNDKLDKAIRKK